VKSSAIISSSLPVFDALQIITNSDVPMSTVDVARAMKLPVSTVHRFLGTLEQTGYVTRYLGGSKFVPGNMPQHLCRALFNRFPVSRASAVFLTKLSEMTRATVTLVVRVGWLALRVETIGATMQVQEIVGPASLSPLHLSLEGRAILLLLSESELVEYRNHMRRSGDGNSPPKRQLWAELDRMRAGGFTISEPIRYANDATAVALPVRDVSGAPLAALGIVGTTVKAGAEAASAEMGVWFELRDDLESALAANPVQIANPFNHLDVEAMSRSGFKQD